MPSLASGIEVGDSSVYLVQVAATTDIVEYDVAQFIRAVIVTFAILALALANIRTDWQLRRSAAVSPRWFFLELCLDVGVLTLLLYFAGGSANPFVSLYLIPLTIAMAGATLAGTYLLAPTNGLASIGVVWLATQAIGGIVSYYELR